MLNYQNGKIYKLWSLEGDKIYIGSTTQPLYKRLNSHKSQSNKCNSFLLFKIYSYVQIELLENFPCSNINELHAREGYQMRMNKDFIVNRCVAGRTRKEYNEDHKYENNEYSKKYYEENKNKHKKKEYMKTYRDKHKEALKQYGKEYSAKYYKENQEKIKERVKQYRITQLQEEKIRKPENQVAEIKIIVKK